MVQLLSKIGMHLVATKGRANMKWSMLFFFADETSSIVFDYYGGRDDEEGDELDEEAAFEEFERELEEGEGSDDEDN
jgi:hypothetical protein